MYSEIVRNIPTTILLVEGDSTDARLIQDALSNSNSTEYTFRVEWVTRLSDALERLGRGGVDIVLLDLSLPDSQGMTVFDQVFAAIPDTLILVLCSASGEGMALETVARGAQDYLVKNYVDSHWLGEACRQVKVWLDAGLPAVPVSVNISAVEFRNKGFLESVAQVLSESGLPPAYLELELTEGILMHDVESSTAVLAALKVMGIKLAIDDFGTGYSSLSYLKIFPIDTLKIDQSFVRDIANDTDNAIVSAVIGMGNNLNHRVIAEGVETLEQQQFLTARQCPEAQGFQFSRPLTAEDFACLLLSGQIDLAG